MSTADELAKLHDLLQKGALSQAEYDAAKARLLAGDPLMEGLDSGFKRLRRSDGDAWIAGVCGGIARVTNVESWIWRLLFAVATPFTGGAMIIVYLLLWIFVPRESDPTAP